MLIYPDIYIQLIPEQWISQIHSLLNLNLQTLIAKEKKNIQEGKDWYYYLFMCWIQFL